MSNPLNESTFKVISVVPNYRALEIIRENKAEQEKWFAEGDPIIKDICQSVEFNKYRSHLNDVQDYLTKQCVERFPQLDSTIAAQLAADLKQNFALTREEIVIILNQLPLNDSLLEMMFPGKFSKEQLTNLCNLFKKYFN